MDIPYSWIGIAAAALVVILLGMTYNRLVRFRNRVQNAWSDVDVQLKRRHDLVPNLVEAVRGYMGHERQTLEAVTQARAQAMSAGAGAVTRAAAETVLSGAVRNFFVAAERYPELHAVENFKLLHEQLMTTENRIAYARQFYNEAVMEYNTAVATFPRNLLAGLMGFRAATMFAAEAGDRASVKVEITRPGVGT